jgi:hypothetical protein
MKLAGLNQLMPTRQQRPSGLVVLGCGLPGAAAASADMRKLSLWAAGALGPACPHRLPRAMEAAAGMENLSLWAYAFCYPCSSGSPGSCLYKGTVFAGISG